MKITKKTGLIIISLLGAILLSILLLKSKNEASNEIRIGAIFPMTGYGASNGQTSQQSLNLAIDSLNRIQNDYVFKAVYEDCKSTAKDATMAYKRLKSQGVKYFLGFGGPFLVGFAPETNDKEEILFAVGTPNMNFLSLSNRAVRVYPTVEMMVDVIMNFIQDNEISDAAIVYLQNEAYSNYNDIFHTKMERAGKPIVYTEGYETSTKDFKNIINKIAAQEPKLVYLAGTGESTAIFIRQMFANPQTENIPIIGDVSLANSDNLRLIGDIKHPIYIVDSYIASDFNSAYKAKYNETPNALQAFVATVPFILNDALHNSSKDASVASIYQYIKDHEFNTLTGELSFSKKTGEPNLNMFIRKVTSVE